MSQKEMTAAAEPVSLRVAKKYRRDFLDGLTTPGWIVDVRGQCVKQLALALKCDRDRRFVLVDYRTGAQDQVNRRLGRCEQDLPVDCPAFTGGSRL
jgi:hypothetical protein